MPPRRAAEISVHRLLPAGVQLSDRSDLTSDECLAEIGDRDAEGREEKCSFYGWAELSVADAAGNGRMVRVSPKTDNPWHADIILPGEDASDRTACKRHASQLAAVAKWRPRPE